MGKTEDVVKTLKRIHEKARDFEKKDFDTLNAKAKNDAEYHLARIVSVLSTLKKRVYGND